MPTETGGQRREGVSQRKKEAALKQGLKGCIEIQDVDEAAKEKVASVGTPLRAVSSLVPGTWDVGR